MTDTTNLNRASRLSSKIRTIDTSRPFVRAAAVFAGLGLLLVGNIDGCAPIRVPGQPMALVPTGTGHRAAPGDDVTSAGQDQAVRFVPPLDEFDLLLVVWFVEWQVGRPYQPGAATPISFDGSGLTRAAYQTIGIDLPDRSDLQARTGRSVDVAAVLPGDLVFTRGGQPEQDLGLVGIAVTPTTWVVTPAPGQTVKVAEIPFEQVQEVRRVLNG